MTSGYDKLAELREKASPGPWKACAHIAEPDLACPCGFSGNVWSADEETTVAFMGLCHPHNSLSEGGFDCNSYQIAPEPQRIANGQLIALSHVLVEVIGELRAELEREAEWWRMKALERPRLETNAISVSMDELSRRNVACRQALSNTDKKLQEALQPDREERR